MVNRLMDLVVLMAELSQKSDKSFREMDKELLHLGYSAEEIEEATFWMSSYWRPVETRTPYHPDASTYRVLGPWESMGLDSEAHGYLLRLQTLGIIDDNRFEKIMNRVLPFGAEKLSLSRPRPGFRETV